MAWLGATTLDIPVWVWVVSALVLAVGFAVDGIRRTDAVSVCTAAGFLLVASTVSLYNAPLNLLAAATGVLVLGVVAVLDPRDRIRMASAAAATVLLADTVWAAGWLESGRPGQPGTALFAISLLGVLGVGLAGPADNSRTCAAWVAAWSGVWIGTTVSWVVLTLAGIQTAPLSTRAVWTAAYLGTMGASVIVASLLTRRRRRLVLVGAALSVLAAWIEMWHVLN